MTGIKTTVAGWRDDNRSILIEVTGGQSLCRTNRYQVKVPYSSMSQTMQQIRRAGGKITQVTVAPTLMPSAPVVAAEAIPAAVKATGEINSTPLVEATAHQPAPKTTSKTASKTTRQAKNQPEQPLENQANRSTQKATGFKGTRGKK